MVTLNSKLIALSKPKKTILLETKFVDIFDRDQGFIKKAPIGEEFSFEIDKESISLVFLAEGFEIFENN